MSRWALAIHGGAGQSARTALTPDREVRCRSVLDEALRAGGAVLAAGGSALDAVCVAVGQLEEAPEFNAARGAVFASNGENQLDASIMDGRTRDAGAVTLVRRVRSPILAARAVMEHTPHVMLAGAGVEALAREVGLELVDPSWFYEASRWNQLQRARGRGEVLLDHSDDADPDDNTYGTVGAVACDLQGHLAAATSTGGMVNKHDGRVGDTGIIGAGTWADDATCAVSGTGHGEVFIRAHVAARVADLMELAGLSLEAAAERVVHQEIAGHGAGGGVIAVDGAGRISMPFNTAGMFRGRLDSDGECDVAIW